MRLTWTQHIEPAGYLAGFIVNELLVDIFFQSLNGALRGLARRAPFKGASLSFAENGQLLGVHYPGH